MNDIVVTRSNVQHHMKKLKLVLKTLKEAGFKLNYEKCSFFAKEIRYFGHIIIPEGLGKDPNKCKAILEL